MARILLALVLICAALSAVEAIKCWGLKDDPTKEFEFQEEKWWVILKAPESGVEKQNFLYVSPKFRRGLFIPDSHKGVDALFNKQHDAAVEENRSAYEEWWNGIMPLVAKAANSDRTNVERPSHYLGPPKFQSKGKDENEAAFKTASDSVMSKVKVWQMWFNDQAPFAKAPPKQRAKPKTKDEQSNENNNAKAKKDKKDKIKYAHSKYMVSFALDGDTAVVLQHSFPATPIQLYDKNYLYKSEEATLDGWLQTRQIFPEKKEKNVFLKAQHAMCVSVGTKEDVKSVIEMLTFSHPKNVNTNFHRRWIDATKPNFAKIIALIEGKSIKQDKETCETEWAQVVARAEKMSSYPNPPDHGLIWGRTIDILKASQAHPPFSEHPPFFQAATPGSNIQSVSKCTRAVFLSSNDNDNSDEIIVVSHVPLTHGEFHDSTEFNDDSKQKPKETVALQKNSPDDVYRYQSVAKLGPFAWLTTSVVLNTPLFVSFWKNDPLPPVYAKDYGVVTVFQIDAGGNMNWLHGQGHEKMGVSTDSGKPWVCFGDSNHRGSEISHAGMMICVKNTEVWTKMNSIIKSVMKCKYALNLLDPEEEAAKLYEGKTVNDDPYSTLIAVPIAPAPPPPPPPPPTPSADPRKPLGQRKTRIH